MLQLPNISEMKWAKLIFHFIIFASVLNLVVLFGKDVVGMAVGHPIEQDVSYVATIICIIWLLFAMKKGKYRKQ